MENYSIDVNSRVSISLEKDQKNQSTENIENIWETLLSIPQTITISENEIQEETRNKSTLNDFQERSLNLIKEDLFYYFSTPESLSHFKNNLEEEFHYEFYTDLDCQNFLLAQKERFKKILYFSQINLSSLKKPSSLGNFNNNFCYKASLVKDKKKIHTNLINANIIGIKLDKCFSLISQQGTDEKKILTSLK